MTIDTQIPEIAFDYLQDYIGFPLEAPDNAGTYYLESVSRLAGHTVTYRLRGLEFDLHEDVHKLLRDTAISYGRIRY